MLHVFIHCVDLKTSKLIWEWIINHGYQPVSSPFGFSNDGVLEMTKDNYIDMITRSMFMDTLMKAKKYVKTVVIEDAEPI